MAPSHRVRRAITRIVTDESLDLYILAATAFAFTILGVTGISSIADLASIILALLAILALAAVTQNFAACLDVYDEQAPFQRSGQRNRSLIVPGTKALHCRRSCNSPVLRG